jgi:uncharacterized repeat protein (TIGR03803 family)
MICVFVSLFNNEKRHTFTDGTDGSSPQGVVIDAAGNLYGTTFTDNGDNGYGVVYKVDSSGNETVLYSFKGGADGGLPEGFLTRDSRGNLYGTTFVGGNLSACPGAWPGCGVIFKVDTGGNQTVLYTFTGGADGRSPNGSLLRDSKGNLYGTTFAGGNMVCPGSGCGVVFKLDTGGKETALYTFAGGTDGWSPNSGLVLDSMGDLYGTTSSGGAFDKGTVFLVTAKGAEKVLHSFKGTSDGGYPYSGLVRDGKGNLYGNTASGGDLKCSPPNGCGTVFNLVSPPQIASFTPASGSVGTSVSVSGVSLSQTTKVAFGGVATTTFTVGSDSKVTATEPTGAVTGKIAITTPGGTATSATVFTVTQ